MRTHNKRSAERRAIWKGLALAAGITVVGIALPAHANLVITPDYTAIVSSDPTNAAAIEAGINAAITRVELDIANNVTVTIAFQEGGGLGSSNTSIQSQSYGTYVSQLQTKQTASADDIAGIASLPASPAAVNGNAASTVTTTLPLLRALGVNASSGGFDSTITLNTSQMYLSRSATAAQKAGKYDLQAVAGHEIDEVLGVGGSGSNLGEADQSSSISPLDLFRFTANGVRSYSTATNIAPYFSITGGASRFVYFNQAGGGSDYSDWGDGVVPADGSGNNPPQMQDAFGTPGVDVNIGGNELASLDVVGWNLTAAGLAAESQVPEPASIGLLALSAVGLLARRRKA